MSGISSEKLGELLSVAALAAAALFFIFQRFGWRLAPQPPTDALFVERGVSSSGACRMLMLSITPTAIHITPQFPFNLLLVGKLFSLERTIPIASVTGVHWGRMAFLHTCAIEYRSGADRRIDLVLADRSGFMKALGGRIETATAPYPP